MAFIFLISAVFIVSIYSYTFTATEDAKKSKERLKNIKFQSDMKENVPAVYKVQYKLYLA
jgi:hypothetical protein